MNCYIIIVHMKINWGMWHACCHIPNVITKIKEGLPPVKINHIVKSVKYMLYWEFDTKENYGLAQKNLYDSYWKSIERCLIVPHDKYLGEALFWSSQNWKVVER